MLRVHRACCAAIVGVLAGTYAVSVDAADTSQQKSKSIQSTGSGEPSGNSNKTADKGAPPKVRIEVKVPPLPGKGATKPADAAAKTGDGQSKSWPKTIDEVKAEQDAKTKPPATWTPQEIADAKARCTAILKRIHATAVPQDPIKEGNCGTPAPIQLISIGQNPQVSLSPPAIVNCDFAEALLSWIENDVQPLAKRHIGTNVIKIEVMSSYSCRNAYGRKGSKLSEHGLANALDIRGFVTAAGKQAYVLEHWGTPQREIAARIAAEKAKAAKALAAQQAAEKAAQAAQSAGKQPPSGTPPQATASSQGAPAAGIARSTIADGLPKITVTIPGADRGEGQSFSLSPSHLGGPKEEGTSKQKVASKEAGKDGSGAKPTDGKGSGNTEAFLHASHAAACRLFNTTLGPEANAAHRNHFHVDMASRKTGTKICD